MDNTTNPTEVTIVGETKPKRSFDDLVTKEVVTPSAVKYNPREIPIYACGGAGINNGANLLNIYNEEMPVADRSFYAKPKVIFIDGSRQNQTSIPNATEANTYFLRRMDDGVDTIKNPDGIELSGGGGDRSFINDVASYNAPMILAKFPPSKVCNIIVFSAAGASGASTGQHLFKEMVRLGYPVIAVVIEVNASASRQSNTNKTLISLINYQQKSKVSAGIHRVSNTGLTITAEKAADNQICNFMLSTLAVMSGIPSRLDEKDIQNWMDYFRVTRSDTPELLEVDFSTAADLNSKNASSIIGIVKTHVEPLPVVEKALSRAMYVKMGIIEDDSHPFDEVYLTACPIDMNLIQSVDNLLTESTDQIKAHDESRSALRSSVNRWCSKVDDENGLV